jgi:hypothetical protein
MDIRIHFQYVSKNICRNTKHVEVTQYMYIQFQREYRWLQTFVCLIIIKTSVGTIKILYIWFTIMGYYNSLDKLITKW